MEAELKARNKLNTYDMLDDIWIKLENWKCRLADIKTVPDAWISELNNIQIHISKVKNETFCPTDTEIELLEFENAFYQNQI